MTRQFAVIYKIVDLNKIGDAVFNARRTNITTARLVHVPIFN